MAKLLGSGAEAAAERSGWHGSNPPPGASLLGGMSPSTAAKDAVRELRDGHDDLGDMIASLSERVDHLAQGSRPTGRDIADGLKMALRELAESEPETLRKFLMAVFEHMADGASKWAGKKLFALLAAALFSAALWMVARKW